MNRLNLKTLTAVVSKYIENLHQTLAKNFIYYRVPFCLNLSDRVYFVIQTSKSNLNLMSWFRIYFCSQWTLPQARLVKCMGMGGGGGGYFVRVIKTPVIPSTKFLHTRHTYAIGLS